MMIIPTKNYLPQNIMHFITNAIQLIKYFSIYGQIKLDVCFLRLVI